MTIFRHTAMFIAELKKNENNRRSDKKIKIPKRFYNDQDWALKNYNTLYKKYKERWIAIYKKRVISSSDDGYKALDLARKKTGIKSIPVIFMENMSSILKT